MKTTLILVSALAITAIGANAFAKSPEASQSAAPTVVVNPGIIDSSTVISQSIEGAVSSQTPVALTSTGSGRMVIGGGRMVIGGGRMVIGGGRMVIGGGRMVIGGGRMVIGGGRMVIGGGRMVIGGGR